MMARDEALSASLEDYLEAVFHIVSEKQAARAKDISERLKVSGSSVTGALRSLGEKGLVNYAPYDVITLTSEGRKMAEDVVRRHEALRDFFVNVLAVKPADADEAACAMEHYIPKDIVERLIEFANFVEMCPRGGDQWIAGFGYHCEHGERWDSCEECIELRLEEVRATKAQGGHETMSVVSLKDLKPGQKARVVKIKTEGNANKRIVEMGVTPGALVEVERVAPLGDPIDIKVKGYHLSLRKADADGIDVEVI
jgi:DtxR family Mn-dependent transcriptional regulator